MELYKSDLTYETDRQEGKQNNKVKWKCTLASSNNKIIRYNNVRYY